MLQGELLVRQLLAGNENKFYRASVRNYESDLNKIAQPLSFYGFYSHVKIFLFSRFCTFAILSELCGILTCIHAS